MPGPNARRGQYVPAGPGRTGRSQRKVRKTLTARCEPSRLKRLRTFPALLEGYLRERTADATAVARGVEAAVEQPGHAQAQWNAMEQEITALLRLAGQSTAEVPSSLGSSRCWCVTPSALPTCGCWRRGRVAFRWRRRAGQRGWPRNSQSFRRSKRFSYAGVEWDSPGGKDRFALARAPVDDIRTPERTNEWALSPLGVWGLDRVRLHANLTILAKLACALSRARAVPVAA